MEIDVNKFRAVTLKREFKKDVFIPSEYPSSAYMNKFL